MEIVGQYTKRYHEYVYVVFRVFIGLLFAQHGAQKLLGWFTDKPTVELLSIMGFAGSVELIGGLLVAVGLVTRLAAFFGVINMLGAYFTVHLGQGLIPIVNKGELALVFLFCFLVIFTHGSMKFSLERLIFKHELF